MRTTPLALCLFACLAACAPPPPPTTAADAPSYVPPVPPAPASPPPPAAGYPAYPVSSARLAPGRWDVDRVRCSDLLGAADDDRAAAAMFYYGYLAAKAGIHVVDVDRIDGNLERVMNECEAFPNISVPSAFYRALRGRR